jgi:phosphoribosylformylglycinamidine cyclo-ligase
MGVPNYEEAGVRDQRDAISAVERYLGPTFNFPRDAKVVTRFGHFAAVLEVTPELGIAICTDSAGSKTMIASALDRYDTIGFDCMAMNVNDVICIGARPIALVDYLGVHTLDAQRAAETLQGLAAAAQEAGVAIPGGEVAQLPDLIGSDGTRPGDERAFDLVGTAIGLVHPGKLVLGHDIRPGDAILGIASTGIHSNGLTLARKVLLDTGGYDLKEHFEIFDRSLGEELLEPTGIYVRPIVELWDKGIETRGLVHITGDGLTNLCRLEVDVDYRTRETSRPRRCTGCSTWESVSWRSSRRSRPRTPYG